MGGHLFVLRGDLTKLHCSAVLIPCDSDWRVVEAHWGHFLPKGSLGKADRRGWAPLIRRGEGRFADVDRRSKRRVRLVVTAGYSARSGAANAAQWVADGVVEAIADLSRNRLSKPSGRVKPLIGLPLVGTGDGGFAGKRGLLIKALIPALQEAANRYNVDIALVLIAERDHAAVQAVRTRYWAEVADNDPRVLKNQGRADRLGLEAAKGNLSLFLGSGVSVPLGVPDWKTLLTEVGGREIDDFDPKRAPAIAQCIEAKIGEEELQKRIARRVNVRGVAPTHLLLAALAVGQTVTTNYDTAYERALDTSVGRDKYRVLTKQLALQPQPWLLKLHGCATRPKTIVITTDDYATLMTEHRALQAVVESLMMTSHLLFVGFSMGDPNFVDAANRVKAVRAMADGKKTSTVPTVLALDKDAVETHDDFDVVPMLDNQDPQEAARLLEIFLDRVSWVATTEGPASNAYLLDPDYEDLFADEESTTMLRKQLGKLVADVGPRNVLWENRGWRQVAELLAQLGDDRFSGIASESGLKGSIRRSREVGSRQ